MAQTHKNGTQVTFSVNEESSERCPRRYSRRVKPTLPARGNTTVQASQISKLGRNEGDREDSGETDVRMQVEPVYLQGEAEEKVVKD